MFWIITEQTRKFLRITLLFNFSCSSTICWHNVHTFASDKTQISSCNVNYNLNVHGAIENFIAAVAFGKDKRPYGAVSSYYQSFITVHQNNYPHLGILSDNIFFFEIIFLLFTHLWKCERNSVSLPISI